MFRRILRYFFSGTLFIVPLVATAYFFFESFRWLDSLLDLPYPGLGFVIIFAAITLFGYLTSLFALKAVLEWFDHVMNRIPLVKLVYSSVKDLLGAFVGEKKKFDKPVLVKLDAANEAYRIGFAMGEDLRDIGLDGMVVVYFPQSYAFAGDHLIVPVSSVRPLDISSAAAMKFIVSGGVSGLRDV